VIFTNALGRPPQFERKDFTATIARPVMADEVRTSQMVYLLSAQEDKKRLD
jgi:hypothetical protein